MRVHLVMIIPILLLISCSSSNARTTPTEEYWKSIMKDVPMPQAVKDVVDTDSSSYDSKKDTMDSSYGNMGSSYHPTIPRWLDEYIEYKVACYLAHAPDYVKSYLVMNSNRKSGTNPSWLNSPDSVSNDKNSFFTRDFDKKHAWEYYFDSNDKNSFFTRDFDKKHAWEYYLDSKDKKSSFTRDFDKKHAWEYYFD